MIARYGSNELDAICNYLGIYNYDHHGLLSSFAYIRSKQPQWWWNRDVIRRMCQEAGFFPSNPETISRFSKLMLSDTKQLDLLGSWRPNESFLAPYFPPNLLCFDREKINPFFAKRPWTLDLENKKVLVVHPFAESIQRQYARKEKLFSRQILPNFDLKVLAAVQSIGGGSDFVDWFAALDNMKKKINQIDFDIALLGCGAYGFPLAAHIKRQGKKAIHIGGSLQLFFGIIGKRWESSAYKGGKNDYSLLFNRYWIRPSMSEKPSKANKVENGCYW